MFQRSVTDDDEVPEVTRKLRKNTEMTVADMMALTN